MSGPSPASSDRRKHSPGDDLQPPEVVVVVSRYHPEITGKLKTGAIEAYRARYGGTDGVKVIDVPGAFELAYVVSLAMAQERFHGFVALGCIVRGETSHDRILGDAVTQNLCALSLEAPVGLGVLTVDTIEQARERAGGTQGNKGADAMGAVLSLIDISEAMAVETDEYFGEIESRQVHAGGGRGGNGGGGGGGGGFKPRKKESR